MLEIGSLVDGKYKILRVVGKGGMSVVYQAVNEKANKIWAIKEVRKDGVQNFEVVKQNLIVETELLKRFNHPNLPSIIDVIDGDGSFLIVMDYIEGNSLSKALETSGAQSQSDVIEWSKQICDVLGYLHSRKPPIIYRDMKPANVMLKPDGNISLIDFGTAREFKSSSVEDTTCLGTQGYAAPEQYGGHGQTDARTDIYCLGATMYHLVTGHNPSMPPYEMYPIRQWNPLLSSGLEEIILKCTQRNPDDRYQSCAELLYALDHYQDLDIENKKAQNTKWKLFVTSVIMTVVMLIGTVGFSFAKSSATSSTYDSLINDGNEASYKKAIEVDPGRVIAYNKLLDYYLKHDGSGNPVAQDYLDENEYAYLDKCFRDDLENKINQEEKQDFYNDYLYKLAVSTLFLYSKDGSAISPDTDISDNMTNAEDYLNAIENNSKNDAVVSRVKALKMVFSSIDEERDDLFVKNTEDDGYWNAFLELTESDWVKNETVVTIKYRCYEKAVYLVNYKTQALEQGRRDTFLEKLDSFRNTLQNFIDYECKNYPEIRQEAQEQLGQLDDKIAELRDTAGSKGAGE